MNRQHKQHKQRVVVCVIVVAFLGLAASEATAQLYFGNESSPGVIQEYSLPISASSTPNFSIASNNVSALGIDAKGNLAAGAFGGALTFFPAPLSGSSTPSATFNNGTTGVAQIAFTAAGDFFTSAFGNKVNLFTHPFSNASTPSMSITNANIMSAQGVAVDAAQNLYISNNGGSGSNTYGNVIVYTPPYTGLPIVTGPATGWALAFCMRARA